MHSLAVLVEPARWEPSLWPEIIGYAIFAVAAGWVLAMTVKITAIGLLILTLIMLLVLGCVGLSFVLTA